MTATGAIPPRTSFSPERKLRHHEGRAALGQAPFPAVRSASKRTGIRLFKKETDVIEINWGKPLSFVVSPAGDIQEFSTAEQARHWLRKKWPVADPARDRALHLVEAAMDCMASVGTARRAFISAARTAGFVPDGLMAQPQRLAA